MAQTNPTYSIATGKPEKPIVDALINKYGETSISWPIILNNDIKTIAYYYEKNNQNKINTQEDIRPKSKKNIPSFFIDYTLETRIICPYDKFFKPFVEEQHSCSYDYIPTSKYYSTIDLDYVWFTGENFFGFELTTFWVPFTNKAKAEDLISKINRRPSWKGANGAHALRKIVDSAEDLNIEYYMVCVNTVSKVGSAINTDGNVYFFRLDHKQIDRLEEGAAPLNAVFCTFQEFIDWL